MSPRFLLYDTLITSVATGVLMEGYSKQVSGRLRKLASMAYEAELCREPTQLQARFADWQQGRITVWELSDLIHRFHNGPSRDLYGMYNHLDSDLMVARAIARGLLVEDDVPEEAQARIRGLMTLYQDAEEPEPDEEPS